MPPQGGRKHPNQEFVTVNTANILFIVGGAFEGLDRIIRQRSAKTGIVGAEVVSPDDRSTISALLRDTEPDDLIRFGLIPELVGRLPVVATLDELNESALIDILVRPKNALIKQYQKMFRLENVDLEVRDSALAAIARRAIKRRTGARGLRSIAESLLLDIMYDLPSISNLQRVVIDETTVETNARPLLIYSEPSKVA